MASTTRKRKKAEWPAIQIIAIVGLGIVLFLVVNFGRRAAISYRVHREEVRLEAQLEVARQTQKQLLDQQAYVQSDAYVEEVARNELKWSKPGETVIIILATPQSNNQPPSAGSPYSPAPYTPFDAWKQFFSIDPH